jgi:hypothetical protein
MADSSVVTFVAAGARYEIDFEDFTAADAGDFRRAVGIPLSAIFVAGTADLDGIAGLVWLVRRRGDRKLSYHSVAEALTYGNVDMAGGDAEQDAEEPDSPE